MSESSAKYAHLFEEHERKLVALFLKDRYTFSLLTVAAQEIYCRLLSRRGPWFWGPGTESSSLERYKDDIGIAENSCEMALKLLSTHGLIETLEDVCRAATGNENKAVGMHASNDVVLDAIRSCWSVKQLRRLASVLSPSKRAPSPTLLNKSGLIDYISNIARKQRNLFGGAINLLPMALKIAGPRCDFPIFRLVPGPLKVCKRAQRLFYLSHNSVDACNGGKLDPAMRGYEFEDISIGAGPARMPGLLALFGKVDFPSYDTTSAPLFRTMESFHRYESAMELWCLRAVATEAGDANPKQDDNSDDEVVCLGVGNNGKLCISAMEETAQEDVGGYDIVSLTRCAYRSLKNAKMDFSVALPIFLEQFTAESVLADVIWHGIPTFEQQKCHAEAVDMLLLLLDRLPRNRRIGKWTIRLLVDCKHIGRFDDARRHAEAALQNPEIDGGDRMTITKQLARLVKRASKASSEAANLGDISGVETKLCSRVRLCYIHDRPTNRTAGFKSRFISYDDDRAGSAPSSVENLVIEHYGLEEKGSWYGMHCEGRLFRTLFALLLWDDAIFAKGVPGVFQTPFQNAPLDLHSNGQLFYKNRSSQIDARLAAVRSMSTLELVRAVKESWYAHLGQFCIGIYWPGSLSCPHLMLYAACMGGSNIAAVLLTLCKNYYHYSGGAPDLFLFKVARRTQDADLNAVLQCACDSDAEEAVASLAADDSCTFMSRFVEVKGPRDRLADRQISWLNILSRSKGNGIAADEALMNQDEEDFDACNDTRCVAAVCYILESGEKVEALRKKEKKRLLGDCVVIE